MVIRTRAAQSYHFALCERWPSGTLTLRQKVIVEPNRQAMVPHLLSPPQPDWRTGSGHVISPWPVQQGPARSNSTGPSHSSLSECGVPSIHQLCQPLPPLRPETVHIQASLHSSHTLKLLTATLMFLFIRPFITLEVKIQMHNHHPYDNPFPTVKGKTSGIKCTWNCAGLFLFVYAGLGGSKCQFSSITLYSTKKCLKVSLLITITQSRGFRIMPSITP